MNDFVQNCVETGNCVLEGVTEEEALKGSLRLKANGTWIQMPKVNTRGKLTSHTKILDTQTPWERGSGQYDDH